VNAFLALTGIVLALALPVAEGPAEPQDIKTWQPAVHGLDHAPSITPAMAKAVALAIPPPPPGIPCYTKGPVVKVFYVYQQGRPNRIATLLPQIREAVAGADAVYAKSALRAKAVRHVRWRMDRYCRLVVTTVAVKPAEFMAHPTILRRALEKRHLAGSSDKSLIYADGSNSCFGVGELMQDSRASVTRNLNNRGRFAAFITTGCINTFSMASTAGALVSAHELGHTLGAVQDNAPYSNKAGHCVDEWDVMCYDDGSGKKLTYRCGKASLGTYNSLDALLDCGLNTYFNPRPAAGSYLAKYWNIARSAWLPTTAPARYDRLDRPTVSLVGPLPGAFVGKAVPVTAVVRSRAPMSSVRILVNGSAALTLTAGAKQPDGSLLYQGSVPVDPYGNLADGAGVRLSAIATDRFGRPGASAVVGVLASRPQVRLTAPGADIGSTFAWAADVVGGVAGAPQHLQLIARALGDDGSPGPEVLLADTATAPYAGQVTWTGSTERPLVLTVRGFWPSGTVDSQSSYASFTPLAVSVTAPQDGALVDRTFAWSAALTGVPARPVAHVQLVLSQPGEAEQVLADAVAAPYGGQATLPDTVADGDYAYLRVRVLDSAGEELASTELYVQLPVPPAPEEPPAPGSSS
jgi:hypothetical protein